MSTLTISLGDAEFATVLVALTFWQQTSITDPCPTPADLLSPDQIEVLISRLEALVTPVPQGTNQVDATLARVLDDARRMPGISAYAANGYAMSPDGLAIV